MMAERFVSIKKLGMKVADPFLKLLESLEPFSPVLIALVYFCCNKDFAGLHYNTDEFGYLSKMIFLSGREIVYPSQWRFGYSLVLVPLTWLIRNQTHFWFGFVIYQSLIWCCTFYMLRYFITFIFRDISKLYRFFIVSICAVYPSCCLMTGFAFTSTVSAFLYMAMVVLICRWDGQRIWEPLASAALAGFFYWVHPLALATFIPLLIAVAVGSRERFRKCVVQILVVLAVLVLFCILYKFIESAMDKRMSDSISGPSHYAVKWKKNFEITVLAAMFFSHVATLGMMSLGAVFCGLSAACHQMLSKFFKRFDSPLPAHAMRLSFFCALTVLAVAGEGAAFFYIREAPIGSYYHWVYCRYLETFTMPLLALCFLVKWRAVYFLLPGCTLFACYYGLQWHAVQLIDNRINTFSLIVKNLCEFFRVFSGSVRRILLAHLEINALLIFIIGICARFSKMKILFAILFICSSVICIQMGLRWHKSVTGTARECIRFAEAAKKARLKNIVTWDSFLHRNRRHIRWHEFVHFSYPRAAFWRAKWNFDTAEKWLGRQEGLLITDYAFPLLRHSDLYIYRFPHRPHKYIVSKSALSSCDDCLLQAFWENGQWVKANKILYKYVYPFRGFVFEPYKTGIVFASSPQVKYLRIKLFRPVAESFYLNGKKLSPLAGEGGVDMYFDISNAVRQYNVLTVERPYANQSLSAVEKNFIFSSVDAVKVEKQIAPEADFFTRLSSPCRLYVTGKIRRDIGNTLIIAGKETQFGPYVSIPPGMWQVSILGKNLHQGSFDINFSSMNESFSRKVLRASVTPDQVSYFFSHEQQNGRFEFRCHNTGTKDLIIENIALSPVLKNNVRPEDVLKLPLVADFGIPLNAKISFSKPISVPLFFYKFYTPESWGLWASRKASLELHLSKLPKHSVDLIFSLMPLTPDQEMLVKDPTGQLLQSFKVSRAGNYILTLNDSYFKKYGKRIVLNLFFPKAKKPETADDRVLSCGFRGIELRTVDELLVGDQIDFSSAPAVCVSGFSHLESWGVWSNSEKCMLLLPVPQKRESEFIRLRFICQAYKKMQSVKVHYNGNLVTTWNIRKNIPDTYDLKLKVPMDARSVELSFEQFKIASPFELYKIDDHRKLGLGFMSVKYLPAND